MRGVRKILFYDGHKVYLNGDYPAVCLNGKNYHIHRLEWIKHFGEIPKNCIIHHKDHNKLNWNIENLEILNRSQHIREHKDTVHKKGISVIARKDDVEIKFCSIEECAKYCGTFTASIQNCFKGKQKQSNGWTFERVVS